MLVLHLLLLCSGALAYVQRTSKPKYDLEDAENIFQDFVKNYNKHYGNEQDKKERFSIFKQNLIKINEKNSDPHQHAVFDINKFSDISDEEFKRTYLGLRPSKTLTNTSVPEVTMDLPDSFDWRDHNAVTPVKDQGDCGSCWTFSTTGTVEGAYAIKHQQLLSFSEQQIVDCDHTNQDNGCNGGWMTDALSYLQQTQGIDLEADYPYTARDGTCKFDKSKAKAKVVGQTAVSLKQDDALRQSLMQLGPISIALSANYFHSYKEGILDCPEGPLNHGVLLVGWGTEKDDGGAVVPYWIIKNSWGIWGEKGYVRVARKGNPCSMKDHDGVVAKVA